MELRKFFANFAGRNGSAAPAAILPGKNFSADNIIGKLQACLFYGYRIMTQEDNSRREQHRGVVTHVAGRGRYSVRIHRRPSGACGGCSLSGLCSNSSDEAVVLTAGGAPGIAEGTEVTVTSTGRARRDAVVRLLAVPLAAMLGGAVVAQLLGADEAVVALAALGAGVLALVGAGLASRRKVYWEITDIRS